jgi:hypothetical protein
MAQSLFAMRCGCSHAAANPETMILRSPSTANGCPFFISSKLI